MYLNSLCDQALYVRVRFRHASFVVMLAIIFMGANMPAGEGSLRFAPGGMAGFEFSMIERFAGSPSE